MPLTFHSTNASRTRFDVISGAAVVGSLWKAAVSMMVGEANAQWRWTLVVMTGPKLHGSTDTMEEAMAVLERDWQSWLKSAGLHE